MASIWKHDKKYLDVDEKTNDINTFKSTLLLSYSIEQESVSQKIFFKNRKASLLKIQEEYPSNFCFKIKVDSSILKSSSAWFQAQLNYAYLTDKFGEWNGAKIVIQQKPKNGKEKWTGVQFQRCTDKNEWTSLHFEVLATEALQPNDEIIFYISNPSPDSILISNMHLNLLTK